MTKPDYWVNIYVIDSVTGRVLTRTRHNNAKGPVHAVCAENWAVRRHSSPPDPLCRHHEHARTSWLRLEIVTWPHDKTDRQVTCQQAGYL